MVPTNGANNVKSIKGFSKSDDVDVNETETSVETGASHARAKDARARGERSSSKKHPTRASPLVCFAAIGETHARTRRQFLFRLIFHFAFNRRALRAFGR